MRLSVNRKEGCEIPYWNGAWGAVHQLVSPPNRVEWRVTDVSISDSCELRHVPEDRSEVAQHLPNAPRIPAYYNNPLVREAQEIETAAEGTGTVGTEGHLPFIEVVPYD